LGTRGWVIVGGGIQLIVGPGAEAVAAALRKP
jgi:phosphotransferase system IIB component